MTRSCFKVFLLTAAIITALFLDFHAFRGSTKSVSTEQYYAPWKPYLQLTQDSRKAGIKRHKRSVDNSSSSDANSPPEPISEVTAQVSPEPESESEAEPYSEPENIPKSLAEPESERNITIDPSPEPGPAVKKYIYVSVLSILMVLILAVNICLIVTIAKQKSLRKPANMIILSLAAADICIALFVIPGIISAQFSERYMANIICKICHYASHLSLAAASFSLIAVALDRLRAIALPLKPKLTLAQSGVVVAVIWFLSCLFGFRAPFVYSITPVTVDDYGVIVNKFICGVPKSLSDTNTPLIVVDFLIVFAIPAVVIVISYTTLLYFLKKNSMSTQVSKPSNRNRKALRLSVLMIGMFIVLHTPVYCLRLYLSRDGTIIPESFDMIRAFDVISFTNSMLDPIVYGFLNKQIRDAFLEMIGRSGQNSGVIGRNRVHPVDVSKTDVSRIATVAEGSSEQTTTTKA